jgi:predicted transcriptional regulator
MSFTSDHLTSETPNIQSRIEPDKGQDLSRRAAISSTVAKALSIVDILATKAENGISLAELSALLNWPKSTTHRYLTTLLELGLAERNSVDRFHLGTKVIELAGSFLANSDLRNESQQNLSELAEKALETIHLAVPKLCTLQRSRASMHGECFRTSERACRCTALLWEKLYLPSVP